MARICVDRTLSKGVDRQTAARVAAKVLVKTALQRGSSDNITVVFIDLQARMGRSISYQRSTSLNLQVGSLRVNSNSGAAGPGPSGLGFSVGHGLGLCSTAPADGDNGEEGEQPLPLASTISAPTGGLSLHADPPEPPEAWPRLAPRRSVAGVPSGAGPFQPHAPTMPARPSSLRPRPEQQQPDEGGQ